MDHNQIFKQMVAFNQATFNNTFHSVVLLQDQLERVAQTALGQTDWLPPEGQNAIGTWVEAYKTGRDNYKKFMDDSYRKVEEYLAG